MNLAYDVIIDGEAREQFFALDGSIRLSIEKKLEQLRRDDLISRHLRKCSDHFVAEVGQYRIAFKVRDDVKVKRVVFIGDHKAYERWYKIEEE